MNTRPESPLAKELRPPAHLAGILERVAQLHRDEVAPREQALRHRLDDETQYLDADGKLHPAIVAARREIMRAAGKAGVYSAHLPARLGGGGLGRTDMIYVEEQVYGYGVGLNPALLSWSEGATPRLLYCHEHQRERFVDPLVRGEKTSLHAVTESGAGSNLFVEKPVIEPASVQSPPLRPCAVVLAMMRLIFGPGVIARKMQATRNAARMPMLMSDQPRSGSRQDGRRPAI